MPNSFRISVIRPQHPIAVAGYFIFMSFFTLLGLLHLQDNFILSSSTIIIFGGLLIFWVTKLLQNHFYYANVSAEGIEINLHKSRVNLSWSQVKQVGLQAIISNSLGSQVVTPFLGLTVAEEIKSQLKMSLSKSARLIRVKEDLINYKGDPKFDLYLNVSQMSEEDHDFLTLISRQTGYVSNLNPLHQ